MQKPLKLTDRMLDVAALLALGHSKVEIAKRAGVDRRTLYRYLGQPEFRSLVDSMTAAVEGLRLDAAGVLLYRASALLAERLRLELADLRENGLDKRKRGASLATVSRIYREAAASQRQALALSLLGNRRQAAPPMTSAGLGEPEAEGIEDTKTETEEPFDFEAWKEKTLKETEGE